MITRRLAPLSTCAALAVIAHVRRHVRRTVAGRLVRVGVVVPMLSSAAVAASSVLGWEPHPLVVGAQAAPGAGMVLAGFGTVAGFVIHAPALSLAGLAVVAIWIWIWTDGTRKARSVASSSAPQVRVLSANILKWNRSYQQLASTVDRYHADAVITVETSALWRAQLQGLWDAEPVAAAPGGSTDDTEVVIWSTASPVASGAVCVRTTSFPWAQLETPSGTLTVVGIHLQSPSRRWKLTRWKAQLSALTAWARTQPGAFVLAGDFNAGFTNPSMRALRAHVTDAACAIGTWWAATFPATTYPLGSLPLPIRLMGLDHVLVGGQAKVVGYGSGILPGSDHDLVWADVIVEAPT